MNTANLSQKPISTFISEETGELTIFVYSSQAGKMVEKQSSELTPAERAQVVAQLRSEGEAQIQEATALKREGLSVNANHAPH